MATWPIPGIQAESRLAMFPGTQTTSQVRWRQFMTMRVRAILMLMAALAMMSLAGCGHYICGAGFGASTCTTGPTPPGGSTTAAFAFAIDPAGTVDGLTLNTSAGTFGPTPSYTGPTTPQNTS